MATKLVDRKTRCGPYETSCRVTERGLHRPVVVRLLPSYLELRLKGCRRAVVLGYDGIYWQAADKKAQMEKRERRKKVL